MSTVVPSSNLGISTSGTILEITPLLPWRPASLSPTSIFFCCATYTIISSRTPAGRFELSLRETLLIPITTPWLPCGITKELSLTSFAFSPNIALSNRSSAESSVSPFGATLPTRISPALTLEPTATIPSASRFLKATSETLGISCVISSAPSLVSKTWTL